MASRSNPPIRLKMSSYVYVCMVFRREPNPATKRKNSKSEVSQSSNGNSISNNGGGGLAGKLSPSVPAPQQPGQGRGTNSSHINSNDSKGDTRSAPSNKFP